jgi:hypothetical protein
MHSMFLKEQAHFFVPPPFMVCAFSLVLCVLLTLLPAGLHDVCFPLCAWLGCVYGVVWGCIASTLVHLGRVGRPRDKIFFCFCFCGVPCSLVVPLGCAPTGGARVVALSWPCSRCLCCPLLEPWLLLPPRVVTRTGRALVPLPPSLHSLPPPFKLLASPPPFEVRP